MPDGTRRPRPAMTFGPLIFLILGFILPVVAGVVVLAIFFTYTAWLAYLSWPRTDLRARLIRFAMLLLVIGLIVLRIVRS
jgi:hypothetical protein